MIDVENILKSLCKKRLIFHSEADFQHELAWQIRAKWPLCLVRLEYPLSPNQAHHLDILIATDDEILAIELKYKTSKLVALIGGEIYWLKDQSAQDGGRYDYLDDIQRLEDYVFNKQNVVGYAIFLTNDSSYWKPPRDHSTNDASFRIHEGRDISGTLSWGPKTSPGTMDGRREAIVIKGNYKMKWQDYYEFEVHPNIKGNDIKFRYLLVRVQ